MIATGGGRRQGSVRTQADLGDPESREPQDAGVARTDWPGEPPRFDREWFLLSMLRDLTATLGDVVGLDEARGFVAVVGARIGDAFSAIYRRAFATPVLDRRQVATACVDLKCRIGGDFFVVEETEDRLVFGNRRCPFGSYVVGRPALCMMTSNVFGRIAAENLGYAKVEIAAAIARGDSGCRVLVHLDPVAAHHAEGIEYFQVGSRE